MALKSPEGFLKLEIRESLELAKCLGYSVRPTCSNLTVASATLLEFLSEWRTRVIGQKDVAISPLLVVRGTFSSCSSVFEAKMEWSIWLDM